MYCRIGLAVFALICHLTLAHVTGILNLWELLPTIFIATLVGLICLFVFKVMENTNILPETLDVAWALPCILLGFLMLWLLRSKRILKDYQIIKEQR
jgi:ABC-type phosphate/phosphonate transport system permease subunit